ncbi:MAG TPA: AMIN domain-containing protein [Candidatus Acidoferrales bacterium]|nr:AMIN domain-containing protein [Candidatus Acidoferrales bacterium]
MKTAMKLTTGILAISMMAGGAWGQKADAIDQARSAVKSLQQQQANPGTAESKPAPGAPAPAVKAAAIPGAKASTVPAKAAAAASESNELKRVNVVPSGDSIQVEISSTRDVTPKVSKLSSPARVVVELPETVVASAQNKISVGTDGVKGVRIGMDGKTPPTTSVVVDLEKALSYEIAPGAAGKLILTLHTQGAAPTVAKSAPAPAPKQAKLVPVKVAAAPVREPAKAASPAKIEVAKAAPVKPAPAQPAAAKMIEAKAAAPKASVPAKQTSKQQPKTVVAAKPAAPAAPDAAPSDALAKPAAPKAEEKKWAMNGKRDPFFSPVVQQAGSGCSTGKKCLEIGSINLRGVVKSDTGFIAVVTNNMNKAYFLRENDPVFNGYVVKITGDSVTFSETVQDKLGKPFTHEVVKRIFTPAV